MLETDWSLGWRIAGFLQLFSLTIPDFWWDFPLCCLTFWDCLGPWMIACFARWKKQVSECPPDIVGLEESSWNIQYIYIYTHSLRMIYRDFPINWDNFRHFFRRFPDAPVFQGGGSRRRINMATRLRCAALIDVASYPLVNIQKTMENHHFQ